ncbi:hypothetical protein ACUNWD_05955 [Sunxiuqinia sp. A32]|uniref:hypothetical protein n=1 Tax=Sunxiuqinia sp. A32 TaxID=3461496 RepID=UPI00404604E0
MKIIYLLILFISVCLSSYAQQVISGDCKNGTGTYQYGEGTVYEGQWKDGKRHGKGKMTYAKKVNESNLPAGPVIEEENKIPENILALRERILEDVNHYGIDYLFFHGTDGMIDLLANAEKVGDAIGHNKIEPQENNPAQNKTIIREYFELAKKIIRTAETTQKLTLEAKQYYYNLIHLNYIRNLCNMDVAAGMKNMRDYTNSIRNFQDAERLQIEADHIMLKAYQKFVDDIAGTIPLVSTALDIVKITTGEDLNGDQIAASKRAFMAFSLIVPEVLERVLVNDKLLKETVDEFAEKMADMTPEKVKRFVEIVDIREHYKRSCDVLAEVYPDKAGQFKWLSENYAKAVDAQTIDPLKDAAFNKTDEILKGKKK